MRWLVYGAGNIGCLYAAQLARSSQHVSVLARGKRVAQLRGQGIELEDVVSRKRYTTSVRVVEALAPDDAYDVVLVVLPKHSLREVLPLLAANEDTPNVMFFGNNAAGPSEMIDALGAERVLLGFPGAAAVPRGNLIRYVITTAREQPTTIGELDGSESPRIAAIASSLHTAGFPVAISTNMDAWLKTHVAKILPTAGALFHAGGHPDKLAGDSEALRLMLRAIREGYEVLRANGIPITPANHRLLQWLPEPLLMLLMKRMFDSDTIAIKIGHAEQARAEWRLLAEEFRVLIDAVNIQTPSIDVLFDRLTPAAHRELAS